MRLELTDEAQQLTIFDRDSDLMMQNYHEALDKLEEQFTTLGLSANQFKVFLYIGKYGSKTAIEIRRALRMHRTEVYSLLKRLMNLGIVSATLERPLRFRAVPPDVAIVSILNAERERLRGMETQKESVLDLWNTLPDVMRGNLEDAEEKFQVLKGSNQIHAKMKQMISQSREEFLMSGSEKNYLQFYHAEIFSSLEECKAEQRFVTTSNERSFYVFGSINGSKVRKIPPEMDSFPAFVIKDGEEALLFLGKAGEKSQKDQKAIWTDSKEMINSLQLLFRLVWSQSMEKTCQVIKA
jgi:HTH-type transcriptional regulator, sugar sensing transcriptional regulator